MITQQGSKVNSSISKNINEYDSWPKPIGPYWLAVVITFILLVISSILMVVRCILDEDKKVVLLSERNRVKLLCKIERNLTRPVKNTIEAFRDYCLYDDLFNFGVDCLVNMGVSCV